MFIDNCYTQNVLAPLGATCGFVQLTWRSAGALPVPRIQSYKHIAPPELGQVDQAYCYRFSMSGPESVSDM